MAAPPPRIRKILIANRGEIAVRLIRGCRDLGIASVAVYSDVDRAALHVMLADEACRLGPAPAAESYLNIARILEAARRTGAHAIHPGYGFLAENAAFAAACRDAGLIFIGPTPESMAALGSKTAARRLAREHNIPILPGTVDAVRGPGEAARIAAEIGFPVMLKAAAGGGGKGMRRVATAGELPSALALAAAEAGAAFGDAAVFLERAVDRPRHVEIQILGDHHGNLVWLGERDCSVQRRHQKVIEESPAPRLNPETRAAMGAAACAAAHAAYYTNAGTVEFLVDDDENFYFLEVNTRLQVEHPVTELVTGLDLVELQIRIASGEPLPFTQADVAIRGHAFECRICAEDPEQNFMPSPGTILRLAAPTGPGVRDDSGVYEGWTVPLEYDPLLSKLIVWGADREQALARMRRALDEYQLGGIRHNLAFFRQVFREPEFCAGRTDTGYIARLQAAAPAAPGAPAREPASPTDPATAAEFIAAALAAAPANNTNAASAAAGQSSAPSAWRLAARQQGVAR